MAKVITNIGSEDARATVLDAIMGCNRKVPFLGRTIGALKLEFTADATIPIAATDGNRRLAVNPDRFASYERGERIGIIAHEAMHVLLRHADRFPRGVYNLARANIACDYAINGWLLANGFDLPADALYDPKYEGWGARVIYFDLLDDDQPQPSWGAFGKDDPRGVDPQPDEIPDEAMAAGLGEIMERELGVKPRKSKFSLERVLSRLLIWEPQWERTFHRCSHVSDLLPAHIEVDRRPRVVVGLDISGSIEPHIRETFVGVLSRVVTPVTVIACDTQVRTSHVWRDVCAQNIAKVQKGMPLRGGGTQFQPAINFAAQERANLVYLTDGETGEQHLNPRGVPITWLIWGDRPNRRVMEPCGRLITVET